MANSVCIHASVAVQIVTDEEMSHLANALWVLWAQDRLQPIAPSMFPYEVCSVLRKKVLLRGELTPEEEREAVNAFVDLDVQCRSPEGHLRRAWELARELNLPTVYDTACLALAQMEGCDFWTVDRRFYNTTHERFPFVYWLGDFDISTPEVF